MTGRQEKERSWGEEKQQSDAEYKRLGIQRNTSKKIGGLIY